MNGRRDFIGLPFSAELHRPCGNVERYVRLLKEAPKTITGAEKANRVV
jgi:hypothetical protein